MMNIRLGAFFAIDGRDHRRSDGAGGVRVAAIAILMAAPLSATAAVGELDPLFGSDGQVRVSGNLGPHLFELPDGRILVVGEPNPGDAAATVRAAQVAVSRFLPTGTPDTVFWRERPSLHRPVRRRRQDGPHHCRRATMGRQGDPGGAVLVAGRTAIRRSHRCQWSAGRDFRLERNERAGHGGNRALSIPR